MKLRKIISTSLVIGLVINNIPTSFAGTLSEDGRLETFEGTNITIDNVLEEDKVDLEIEGNTMVNVANQKDAVPITKGYTVEGANHIPLQGEYDGKAKPVIEGNSIVNLLDLNLIDKEPTENNPAFIDTSKNELGYDWSIGQSYNNWIQINNKLSMIEPNKTYTIVMNIKQNNPMLDGESVNLSVVSQLWAFGCKNVRISIPNRKTGIYSYTFTTEEDLSATTYNQIGWLTYSKDVDGNPVVNEGKFVVGDIMLLEGDYSNKEVPGYFKGLKSSFEDQLVTQDMVNNSQEKPENLDKYKVEYKVTGKNLFDEELMRNDNIWDDTLNGAGFYLIPIKCKPNTTYTLSIGNTEAIVTEDGITPYFAITAENTRYVGALTKFLNHEINGFNKSATITSTKDYIYLAFSNNYNYRDYTINNLIDIQLEEGSTATEYEPYRESIKTFYLNSPLLEGDTIEDIDGKVTHVKRYGEVTLDGSENWQIYTNPIVDMSNSYFLYIKNITTDHQDTSRPDSLICDKVKSLIWTKFIEKNQDYAISFFANNHIYLKITQDITPVQWLQDNPITVVYKLAEPIYETISDEPILIDSYKDGYLNFDTITPISSATFEGYEKEMTYLKPSTSYTIQFSSSNVGNVDINLGGAELLNQSIIKGLNNFTITTPSVLSDNILKMNGIGFNLSNLVVTEATDKSFSYFEGMKSVGQNDKSGNKIEILSNNRNFAKINNGESTAMGIAFKSENNKIYVNGTNTGYVGYDIVQNKATKLLEGHALSNSVKSYYSNIPPMLSRPGNYVFYVQSNIPTGAYSFSINIVYDNDKMVSITNNIEHAFNSKRKFTVEKHINGIFVSCWYGGITFEDIEVEIQLEKGDIRTEYAPHQSSTLQIPLSEPLSSLPNGIKDRIIKKDGQWVIEKNCGVRKYQEGDINLDNIKTDMVNTVYPLDRTRYIPLDIGPSINTHLGTTHIFNDSIVPANMKTTIDRTINIASEAIALAKENPTTENLARARMWINLLEESSLKDELQNEISNITNVEDVQLERKSATANLDVYIKSENMLSMSLNTNSITFDNYSGVEDMELEDAIGISINSSLPYDLTASLESEIKGSDNSNTMDTEMLKIKDNSKNNYQSFVNTNDKVILNEDCSAGNYISHNIDLMLQSNNAYVPDVYKTTIKFEATQK